MVLTFQNYPYQKPQLLHRYLTDPALCDIFATKAAPFSYLLDVIEGAKTETGAKMLC